MGEIVVDRDHVHALAGERVQVDRKRCHQGLAFAGLHLGDVTLVQHHAADQLDVEVPLAEGPLGRLADRGEGRDQEVVQGLALFKLLLELGGPGAQRIIGELHKLRFERIDGVDPWLVGLDASVVGGTEKLACERTDHGKFVLQRSVLAGFSRETWQAAFETGTQERYREKQPKSRRDPFRPAGQRYGPVHALSTAQNLSGNS